MRNASEHYSAHSLRLPDLLFCDCAVDRNASRRSFAVGGHGGPMLFPILPFPRHAFPIWRCALDAVATICFLGATRRIISSTLRGFAKKKKFKKSEITMEVVSLRIFFFFLKIVQSSPQKQYWYFGVVYHVYSVRLYISKSCWLLWFECSVHVSDGFPKTKFGWWGGGGVSSIQVFCCWIFLTLQSP